MLGEAAFANLYRVLNHPICQKKVDLSHNYLNKQIYLKNKQTCFKNKQAYLKFKQANK